MSSGVPLLYLVVAAKPGGTDKHHVRSAFSGQGILIPEEREWFELGSRGDCFSRRL